MVGWVSLLVGEARDGRILVGIGFWERSGTVSDKKPKKTYVVLVMRWNIEQSFVVQSCGLIKSTVRIDVTYSP